MQKDPIEKSTLTLVTTAGNGFGIFAATLFAPTISHSIKLYGNEYSVLFIPNMFDPLGFDDTHGQFNCLPDDCCPILQIKTLALINNYNKRIAQQLADPRKLKTTNPKSYNGHIDQLEQVGGRIVDCLEIMITKGCTGKPTWKRKPILPRVPVPPTTGVNRVPVDDSLWDQYWQEYKYNPVSQALLDVSIGAGSLATGGLLLEGLGVLGVGGAAAAALP